MEPKDKVSKEDMLVLELLKTKMELCKMQAQKSMSDANLLGSEYKQKLEFIKQKYNLTEFDQLSEDGDIKRGKAPIVTGDTK